MRLTSVDVRRSKGDEGVLELVPNWADAVAGRSIPELPARRRAGRTSGRTPRASALRRPIARSSTNSSKNFPARDEGSRMGSRDPRATGRGSGSRRPSRSMPRARDPLCDGRARISPRSPPAPAASAAARACSTGSTTTVSVEYVLTSFPTSATGHLHASRRLSDWHKPTEAAASVSERPRRRRELPLEIGHVLGQGSPS